LLVEAHEEIRALKQVFDHAQVQSFSDWTFEQHLNNIIEFVADRTKISEFFEFYVMDCMEIFADFDGTAEIAERYAQALVTFGQKFFARLEELQVYGTRGQMDYMFGKLHKDNVLLYLIEEH
jgi:hypothetical protein